MLALAIRLVFSLAVVIGLLILLAKFGSRRFSGGRGDLVQVVHRQALTRTSSVAVVTIGERVLVLGTTDQQVRLLAELDPDELDLDVEDESGPGPAVGTHAATTTPSLATLTPRTPGRRAARPAATGALGGSVLSPATWRQAVSSVSRRAS